MYNEMMYHLHPSTLNPANDPSAGFFGSIGIAPGARVLDVGCGNGDLSRLIAGIAGSDGEVIGIDRNGQALAAAQATEADPGVAPIEYHQVDLAGALPDLGQFDAIVGRRVLMYLPDAAGTLKRLKALAKLDALLAFQEHSRTTLPAGPGSLALHRQLYHWHWSTVASEGGDVELALQLPQVMEQLGLSVANVRGEAILLHPGRPSFLPVLTRGMLPRIVGQGIASVEQIDPDTLDERIEDEHRASGGTIVWDIAFLVAARARSAQP